MRGTGSHRFLTDVRRGHDAAVKGVRSKAARTTDMPSLGQQYTERGAARKWAGQARPRSAGRASVRREKVHDEQKDKILQPGYILMLAERTRTPILQILSILSILSIL